MEQPEHPGHRCDGQLSYSGYLRLPELLALQAPHTTSSYELLFIAVHQCIEILWKAAISMNEHVIDTLKGGQLDRATRSVADVIRLVDEATRVACVLDCLTPEQFATFRSALGRASGAESNQFHVLESQSGFLSRPWPRRDDVADEPAPALAGDDGDTLRTAFLAVLVASGVADADRWPRRVGTAMSPPDQEVAAQLSVIYAERHLCGVAALADVLFAYDDAMANFRWHHYQLVQRVIGTAKGTGGTDGLRYLSRNLLLRLFPELVVVRAHRARVGAYLA